MEKSYGKYLVINGLTFTYGQKEIIEAYLENTTRRQTKDSSYRRALSYRFVKDEKDWRVFISLPLRKKTYISNKLSGAIGIDINADHLAVCETERFGNPFLKYYAILAFDLIFQKSYSRHFIINVRCYDLRLH